MDVSIIVINFNTFELTSACLRSVYEKTHGIKFEVILVDNGSDECSPIRFKEAFPNIILVVSKENVGFAKGNNLGLKYATGDFVLLLNSDTELLNNAVLFAYQRLHEDPNAGALTGKLFYPDGRVQENVQRFPSIRRVLFEIFRIFYLWDSEKRGEILMGGYFNYKKEIYADWVWATFLLIKREVIEKFPEGILHEDFFMYEEDKQWAYYLQKIRYKILFSPVPNILHFSSGSSRLKETHLSTQTKILKNEYHLIGVIKGVWYARVYFFLKSLQYLTSGYKYRIETARLYFRISLSRFNKNIVL